MGIKNLNRYLLDNCSENAIKKVHLSSMKDKTIVIDTSIYLYRFTSENALMENMYLFISTMLFYKITPIFIFDGKPPVEKNELIQKRKVHKKEAESKYAELLQKFDSETSIVKREEYRIEIDRLKKQFVRIRLSDIQKVKELMNAFGVLFYESAGEADQLCSYFMKNQLAWACISDDMDMFLYEGSNRILRNFSLMNHTIILYDKSHILTELNMDETRFREVMVLCGTDYNVNSTHNLYDAINWYSEFINDKNNNNTHFYDWLINKTTNIFNQDELMRIYNMFTVDNNLLTMCKNVSLTQTTLNHTKIHSIMKDEGFVFVST